MADGTADGVDSVVDGEILEADFAEIGHDPEFVQDVLVLQRQRTNESVKRLGEANEPADRSISRGCVVWRGCNSRAGSISCVEWSPFRSNHRD